MPVLFQEEEDQEDGFLAKSVKGLIHRRHHHRLPLHWFHLWGCPGLTFRVARGMENEKGLDGVSRAWGLERVQELVLSLFSKD